MLLSVETLLVFEIGGDEAEVQQSTKSSLGEVGSVVQGSVLQILLSDSGNADKQ